MALTKVNRGGLNTGISDSSDANAITIDSSENVLIGDASPQVTSKLTVSGNGSADTATFMYDGSAGTYLDINTNTANGIISLEANARSGNYPPLTFITSGSERLRIQAGGGISFNGDTAASNALDDYEEGTWTPTFFGSSTAGTYTYTTSGNSPYANYTKIGRTVTLQVMLNNITESSAGSGDVFVGGLPFDKVAGSAPFGCVHLNNWNTTGTITGVTVHPTTFANSGDKLQFTLDFDNTASNSLSLSHLKSGSSDVGFSLTYLTA